MDTKILTAIILIIVVIVLAYSPFYKRYQLIHWIKIRSRCPVSINCSCSIRYYFSNLNDLFLL